MAVGVGAKSELKDLGELGAYFKAKGVKVQESIMLILPFEAEMGKGNPLIEEFRKDLEKKFKGIAVLPRETKEGKVSGLTIWVDLKRA
ncbi:MAG: hypothetical protein KGH71_00800 [Candidatus Micrarchaeota archaeon]|nr:hypothetical protein [Candidatus Micrarchaeota archaeon]